MGSESIFVGDHLNDIQVMKEAGFGIAFNCNENELKKVANVCIDKKNLREILRYIFR